MSVSTNYQLDPDQLARIRTTLHDQQRFRRAQINLLRAEPGTGTDAEIRQVVLDGAKRALQDIQAALARLADGTFGRCTDCDRDLGSERLRVLPQSPRCTVCEQAQA